MQDVKLADISVTKRGNIRKPKLMNWKQRVRIIISEKCTEDSMTLRRVISLELT
jgi:hypothetical protein